MTGLELVKVELAAERLHYFQVTLLALRGPDAVVTIQADEGHVNLYSKIGGPNS